MTNATPKQTWAIFCLTGYDVRNCGLTLARASQLIDLAKKDKESARAEIATLPGAMEKSKGKSAIDKTQFEKIWNEADLAGNQAVMALDVQPMVVQQHANMLNDSSPVVKQYYVADGPCGFAWVNVKPGNSAFAKWLKDNQLARADSYYGGVCIWIHQFNQSIQKKEKYAYAFANVLTKHGIKAYASSRMD